MSRRTGNMRSFLHRLHQGSGPEGGRPGFGLPGGTTATTSPSPMRPLDAKAEDATRAGSFVSGAPGVAVLAGGLALAAVLLLAPGAARAVNDCGALNAGNSFTETCEDAAYTGIVYWDQPNAVRITVSGTTTAAAMVITAGANNGVHNGITIRTNDDTTSPRTSPVRNIALTVGGMGTVAIRQSGTRASSWYNNRGILVLQRDGDGATTTLDIKSGVTIGTDMDKMENGGIEVRTFESDAGAVTVTNRAAIYSEADGERPGGIYIENAGSGAVMLTNFGAIVSDARGINVEDTGSAGAVTITNSGAITSAATTALEGIRAVSTGKDAANTVAGVTITHSAGAITVAMGGVGISAHVGTSRSEDDTDGAGYQTPRNAGLAKVEVTGGSVTAKGGAIQARNYEAGSVEVVVSEGVTLASTEGHGIEARLTDVGNMAGTISVTNAATIAAGTSATTAKNGITVSRAAGSGTVSVTNSGAITASGYGISAVAEGAGGTVSVTNSGALGTAEDRVSRGISASHDGTSGSLTVASSGAIHAEGYGINVESGSAGTVSVSVEHSAGAISAETQAGINAQNFTGNAGEVTVEVTGGTVKTEGQSKPAVQVLQNGTGDAVASVSSGAMLISKHNAGVYANLEHAANAAGQVKVTQGGTIAGRKGVYARAGRASAAGERREAMKPVLDVTWTGSFSHGTTASVAQTDADRFLPTSVVNAVAFAQEVETEKAIRYGQAAGIEAQVLSWRAVMTQVAKGDDPGAFADAAAVTALFDENADAATKARAAAVIAALRKVLANEDLDTIPGAAAIDTDGTTGLSDDEIEAYLSVDDPDSRMLLQNVLAQSFTDEEKAVLRAVVTNTGLEAALADEDAGFTDTYKSDVRELLDKYNVGDIRVAMTGGSIIASRGDGIRAYYATPHANNGAISVSVAAGTTVSGAMAGIYVANAGRGADGVLKQSVTVNGTVRGGTDAAVHLVGGGRLMVGKMGRVLAGSSGVAVLVNEPGPAHLTIDGVVRGGRGGAAAVHLTGGGTVVVGTSGRVEANGATRAIQGDGVEVEVKMPTGSARYQEDVDAATAARVEGDLGPGVTPRFVDSNGLAVTLPVKDGKVDTSGLRNRKEEAASAEERARLEKENRRLEAERQRLAAENKELKERTPEVIPPPGPPETPPPGQAPQFEFMCEEAMDDRRCELYEALPSVLLAMNGMLSYAERSSAVRDANGAWARVEGARGKWEAKKAKTTGKLSYEYRRGGVRAGVDLGAGEHGRVGVSVHLLNGKAERSGVGDVEVDGMGAGASATWRWGEWYVDAQAGATWYEVGVDSANRESGALVKEADGLGYAMEVEAGRGMALGEEGLVVTPRVGLAWSKVEMSDFTFTNKAGTQETVSVEDAHSARGRLGVLVEAEAEMGERSGRLFGSLDVEQEFSDETQVNVGITKLSENELETEVRPTTVRLGLGGVLDLGEDLVLRGTAGYETSGSGTSGYGGGLELNLRF